MGLRPASVIIIIMPHRQDNFLITRYYIRIISRVGHVPVDGGRSCGERKLPLPGLPGRGYHPPASPLSPTSPTARMTPAPRITSSGGMTPPRIGRDPVSRSLIPSPKCALVLAVLAWVYWPTLRELYETWTTSPEYSHGLLVPFFALFLLTKANPNVTGRPWPVLGFAALTVAILLRLGGAATSFLPLEGLSLILCLAALAMIVGGAGGLRRFAMPLVFLVFMVPLPYEASRLMGAELQRVGTVCSAFLLQCFGQPAIVEGNRILVENVTLNVVEACSGLRMLVTFIAFSVAAVAHGPPLAGEGDRLGSAVPIALATNVLGSRPPASASGSRTVTKDADHGLAHDFTVMMMPVGLGFLVLELWVLKHLLIERPAASPRPHRRRNGRRPSGPGGQARSCQRHPDPGFDNRRPETAMTRPPSSRGFPTRSRRVDRRASSPSPRPADHPGMGVAWERRRIAPLAYLRYRWATVVFPAGRWRPYSGSPPTPDPGEVRPIRSSASRPRTRLYFNEDPRVGATPPAT